MNILLEILTSLLDILFPWGHRHDDRSSVGESDLDRKARHFLYWLLAIVLLLAAAGWLIWRFLLPH